MDEQPQPLSTNSRPQIRTQQHHSGPINHQQMNIQQEIYIIKQDAQQVRGAVLLLEQEQDSLRKAIRKLKLENGRMKQKMKTLQETVTKLTGIPDVNGEENGAPEAEKDYDELERDFFLIGGIHDPLSLRYEVAIRDDDGTEHKSAERYYWYKMAETFEDTESMKKILNASNVPAAEEAVKAIKNFNESTWENMRLKYWEQGQRFKFTQVRWIANLLVLTGSTYLAVASQDKFFGTGWRKNREESNKTIFWDGLNEGGKVLMKIRYEMKAEHSWNGPQEEEDTRKKIVEMKRYVWRRLDAQKRMMAPPSVGGRGGGVYTGRVFRGIGGGPGGSYRRPVYGSYRGQ